MTSDHYSLLGVTPAAEDVVIRAAYRALMRHYHPDTNRDPEAQRRAQDITAAFAVLRDPAKRAEYDASRAGHDLSLIDDHPAGRRKPAMRGLGIASAALAVALVVTVSVRPQPEPPRTHVAPTPRHAPPAKPQPVVELEPESDRLARLSGDSPAVRPPPEPVMALEEAEIVEPLLIPPHTIPSPAVEPVRMASAAPRRAVTPPMSRISRASPTPRAPKVEEPSVGCRPDGSVIVSSGCKNDRLAALDRMAAGFFSQSMAHADAAKKELLMTSHTRSAAARVACRSDSCVTDAYLRQMREISAIMEGRASLSQ